MYGWSRPFKKCNADRELMCFVSPGSYEGWEGGSFPCIRVKKNRDSLPRLVVVKIRTIRNQLSTLRKLPKTKVLLSKLHLLMKTYCLCEQDIGACAWRRSSGPGSRSGWDEPGPRQGPWGRLLWKSLWIQRQNQLSILLQPHHVWDWGGALRLRKNYLVYQPTNQDLRLIAVLLPPSFRWWFQPTRRKWVSFRRSVSLSVSVLWTSACHWLTSCCPANRPSRASTTGTSTEAQVWWTSTKLTLSQYSPESCFKEFVIFFDGFYGD